VTTYATFLRFFNGSTTITCNVVDFTEDELAWSGEEDQSFTGTWLSTLRDPLRRYTATVEFLTPPEVEAFRAFVSNIDVVTGRATSYKTVFMQSDADGALRGWTSSLRCQVIMGRMQPHEYTKAPATVTQSWTVDLTIREV
jgi:hypothetical protein